jgi:glycosyltransferase involved in cell wall biosynthesis
MSARVSVIIRSKDEADRLRLTLTSLACQSESPEVVVVNDGSSDHTKDVIAMAEDGMNIVAVHNTTPARRSAASNAGVTAASGDVVLFLDGDKLAAPDLVSEHLRAHSERSNIIVRGSTYNLRCTRPFLDPEMGSPQPGEEARVERMSATERARALVTRQQIRNCFHEIDRRSQPGVYPGFGPRKLFELEMEALTTATDCPVLWAASSGANMSIGRTAFLDNGGFKPELDNNEHRELALRLCQRGRVADTGWSSGSRYDRRNDRAMPDRGRRPTTASRQNRMASSLDRRSTLRSKNDCSGTLYKDKSR